MKKSTDKIGRLILLPDRAVSIRKDLKEASNYWSGVMTEALEKRFGKGQYGHCLIIFGFQRNPIMTYITTGRHKEVARLLRELAENIEAELNKEIS